MTPYKYQVFALCFLIAFFISALIIIIGMEVERRAKKKAKTEGHKETGRRLLGHAVPGQAAMCVPAGPYIPQATEQDMRMAEKMCNEPAALPTREEVERMAKITDAVRLAVLIEQGAIQVNIAQAMDLINKLNVVLGGELYKLIRQTSLANMRRQVRIFRNDH